MNSNVIPNGKFTIQRSSTGTHRTFNIHTNIKGKYRGVRFVSLLTGPNNSRNYTSFAIVSDDRKRLFVFNSLRGHERSKPSKWESYACILECMLLGLSNDHYEGLGYSISGSRRCARCNRVLTTPESISRGLGPECIKM